MSTIINSNGTLPSATNGWNAAAIASSTNASPIAVTYSAPHGFTDGDTISVEGHLVNTNANSPAWVCHVTGATTLELVGSTGNGVGGATGYSYDYALAPRLTVPADTDLASASSVNTPISSLFDLSPFLYARTGQYRIYQRGSTTVGSAFGTASSTALNSSTWTDLASLSGLFSTLILNADDIIQVRFSASASLNANVQAAIGVGIAINGGAAAPVDNGSVMLVPGATCLSDGTVFPISGFTEYAYGAPVSAAGDSWTVALQGKSGSGTPTLVLSHYVHISFVHLRINA